MSDLPPVTERERVVINQIDGHWCYDWDEMAVSAWTPEYEACVCFRKTRLGRFCNKLYMLKFNLKERWVRRYERRTRI